MMGRNKLQSLREPFLSLFHPSAPSQVRSSSDGLQDYFVLIYASRFAFIIEPELGLGLFA
jgi:hypothetical protein